MATTDTMLIATQEWLKSIYGELYNFAEIEAGETGRAETIKYLIKALQIELRTTVDGIWGSRNIGFI